MAKLILDEQFKNYLLSTYPVDESLLNRLVEDLGDYFSRDVKEFIAERHHILHGEGMKNEEIYKVIQRELRERRFAGPELSERQIRRVIYG
ncbi:MAG: hypothetical protein PF518_13695 [Spirochaetaceae bacterium]|jgi:hypothetical protein|nr:hypothetical protein [Spirochaetaceae bacterium]